MMNTEATQMTSLLNAVLRTVQPMVDRNFIPPIERNWHACLSFAYHMQEEAWEVIRELPRKEWKDQTVNPNSVLMELADTQIQLLVTLAYAGFSGPDLANAVFDKLGMPRPDWK